MSATYHVTITGRVQGVSYRAWAQETARAKGLTGWVRNKPDGSVEAVVAGPEDAVREMLEAMKDGPRAARVETVEAAESAWAGEGFEIRG